MKEAKPKRVHTVSFHVYKVLEKAILNYSEKIQNSDSPPAPPPCTGGEEESMWKFIGKGHEETF